MAEFRGFREIGTPSATGGASAEWPPDLQRGEFEMSNFSFYAKHLIAGVAAVFVSGLLMVNSLAVSATEVHSVAGILA
jgi:hypothetical protein